MTVRFLPSAGDDREVVEDRSNLAEVIELRSHLSKVDSPAETHVSQEVSGRLSEANRVLNLAETETSPPPPAGNAVQAVSDDKSVTATPGEPGSAVYEDAVRLLARKARSSGELRTELLHREYSFSEVELVIDDFIARLYLDDTGLARVLTESLREKKSASRSQIRTKLRDRRFPDDVIEIVVAELPDEEELSLLQAAAHDRARRLVDLDRPTAERRLLSFLARRGWSGEPAYRAVREALDGASPGKPGGVRFR